MGRTKRMFGKEADKVFKESGKRRIETALFAAHELGRQHQLDMPVRLLQPCLPNAATAPTRHYWS